MFFGVPTMYHRLAATGGPANWPRCACVSRARRRSPADLWHQLADEGVDVLERYGMTETLLTLSNPLEGERRPGSVGLPLPGVEAASTTPTTTAWGSSSCAAPRCAAGTGAGTTRRLPPADGSPRATSSRWPTTATSPSAAAAPS